MVSCLTPDLALELANQSVSTPARMTKYIMSIFAENGRFTGGRVLSSVY